MTGADSPRTLPERWEGLGHGSPVVLDAVDLWTVDLPFRAAVRTALGTHRARPLVLVHLLGRTIQAGGTDDEPVEGWGECAALADTAFDAEDVGRSLAVLEHRLVPELLALAAGHEGALPGPSGLGPVRRAGADAPLSIASLEMAVADIHLRSGRRSLAELLGVEGQSVELGAVCGQASSVDTLVAEVGKLVDQGYTRVKLKIGPGWDVAPLEGVRRAFPQLGIQADANGSYAPSDVDRLSALDRFGLLCLEQPLDRHDLDGHTALAARMTTPICLDEGVDSPARVFEALELGACSVVCVKPARLGGLGPALDVVERCTSAGVPLWMGGMFESGYARGVNAAVAALPGFSWPGDLSPSRAYLGDDLVPEPRLSRPRPRRALTAALPGGPGMGPPPDPAVLERFGIRRRLFDALRS
ncbi:MAG: o-succinylbenzoate synthase [Acidimicrobiales bacterium]|jgi:O-succinylbenzoate synthase